MNFTVPFLCVAVNRYCWTVLDKNACIAQVLQEAKGLRDHSHLQKKKKNTIPIKVFVAKSNSITWLSFITIYVVATKYTNVLLSREKES